VLRFKALETVSSRQPITVVPCGAKISDYYGCNVFGNEAMRDTMSGDYYKKLQQVIRSGARIENDLAEAVASAMKNWAMSKGATHYTHWFQPLNGSTAEKHDSFFDITNEG